ncbi:fork head domain transcription factor slp2-like [Mya arenaria]|uniref:fork head domain transcription factor slp2-like n=1 Tax=Mya arenaria TaxID=6604 RepID=UPI0022E37A65|nr:fork head domain transcription factor slp2-like [Mya arenaria]
MYGTTMQGGYLDGSGFQNGLYAPLGYDGSSIKLHHGHFQETQENCYHGYNSPLSGSVHYTSREPPSYSESAVFQNGYISGAGSPYYKMAGNTEFTGLSREGMLLKTDIVDNHMAEGVIGQRYESEVNEMTGVPSDQHQQTSDQHNLKLVSEHISEFKTDLNLQEPLPTENSSECLNSVELKETDELCKADDSVESGALATDDDKARGNSDVKPALSYIALIAKAILESNQKRLSLGSIYNWIEKNYPYYINKGQGWRNSVRHNLSLNDCFIKAGRCEDGKGNYWAIHPANIQDFMRGDFRQRRRSRRRGRKKDCDLGMYHMANGYLGTTPPIAPSVPFNPAPALSSIYSPYTEAERRAYRLDDALLRQNMNNPFMKWYHGNGSYGNQTPGCNSAVYNSPSPQWQTGYPEQPTYPLNAALSTRWKLHHSNTRLRSRRKAKWEMKQNWTKWEEKQDGKNGKRNKMGGNGKRNKMGKMGRETKWGKWVKKQNGKNGGEAKWGKWEKKQNGEKWEEKQNGGNGKRNKMGRVKLWTSSRKIV